MDTPRIRRRHFLLQAGWLGVAGLATPLGADDAPPAHPSPANAPFGAAADARTALDYPRNDLDRVRSVVGASHSNLDVVRDLVLEQPALAKASWDWGFGDWESALGAASHTGRHAIAEFLIAHGARPTLYSATMMGQLDVVRGFLEADPDLALLPGPHGIPLQAHARFGGAEAEPVLAYLLDRFGEDDRPFGTPGTEALEARYGGSYRFETDPPFSIQVAVGGMSTQWLLVGAGANPSSRILEVEPDVYAPAGAPAVRLHFQVADGQAQALTIHDGPMVATGQRADEA